MGEHDQIFKRVFRVPEHAAGELAAVLPKQVLDLVDLGSLALVETDLVSQKLQERFSDALFGATLRGVPGYIWLLLEHQSEPDRWMVLRVLEYLVVSWMRIHELDPDRKSLPPFVCVVVHHGEHGWKAPTRLHDLVEGLDQVPELRKLVPDFEIIVDELTAQSDDELKRRPLGTFPKVVLWVLRDARTVARLYERMVVWAEELSRLSRESPDDARTVMRYILSAAGDEPFERIWKRLVEVVPAAEEVMATAAQELIQRGKVEGLAQGVAEGKAQGVLAVFEARGVAVSADERARITGARDVTELDRWLRQAVTAKSVAELFSH